MTVAITDNDSVGVLLAESDGGTAISEAGPTSDTYTLVLNSRPTADVTVNVDPDAQGSVGAGAGTPVLVTFTVANWSVPQTITLTAVDDETAEANHTCSVAHTIASADAAYHNLATPALTAAVADNDAAGITLTQSGGATLVREQGPSADTFTLVLDSRPIADLTITAQPDAQTDLGGGPGVAVATNFNPGGWNAARTLVVMAVDDGAAEGPHTSTISFALASADPDYAAIVLPNLVVTVLDNDTPGVSIQQTGSGLSVNEQGPTSDAYTIVLTGHPAADVTMTVAPDGQLDLGAGPGTGIELVFTAANWDVPRTIIVTAVQDGVAEGTHSGTITHTLVSADADYSGLAVAPVVAEVGEGGGPALVIAQSGGTTALAEAGPTSDTYTLTLQALPAAEVTVSVQPDDQSDAGAGPGQPITMVFTPADWDTPQTVTLTAVDDQVAEGPHNSTISHALSSPDPAYDGLATAAVSASIVDNDAVGVEIQPPGPLALNEQGATSGTYTLALLSRPTVDVQVTVAPDEQVNAGAGPGRFIVLQFTPANWNTPQTVTLAAVDDNRVEGPHVGEVTHAASSMDDGYDHLAIAAMVVDLQDNDLAGILVDGGADLLVSESGPTSDTFSLVLQSSPSADVTMTFTPDAQTDLGGGAGAAVTLAFGPQSWNVPRTLVVTAVADGIVEGPHQGLITTQVSSLDPDYHGLAVPQQTVQIADTGDGSGDSGEPGGDDGDGPGDAPTVVDRQLAAVAGDQLDINLAEGLPEEQAYYVLTQPNHGALGGQAPQLSYRPAAGFVGTDSFRYCASLDGINCTGATVTIAVQVSAGEQVADDSPAGPIALAGPDLTANQGDALSFDGSASFVGLPGTSGDPGSGIVSYTWDFNAADGVTVEASGPRPDHVFDEPGRYEVVLTVTDRAGRTAQDVVVCTVQAVEPWNPLIGVTCGPVSLAELMLGMISLSLLPRRVARSADPSRAGTDPTAN